MTAVLSHRLDDAAARQQTKSSQMIGHFGQQDM
jgi:hypothetical protein